MAFVDPGANFVDPTGTGGIDPSIVDASSIAQNFNPSLSDLSVSQMFANDFGAFGGFDSGFANPTSPQAIDYTQATQGPISGDPAGQLDQQGGQDGQNGQDGQDGQNQGQNQGTNQQPQQNQQQSPLLQWINRAAGGNPFELGGGGPETGAPYRVASLGPVAAPSPAPQGGAPGQQMANMTLTPSRPDTPAPEPQYAGPSGDPYASPMEDPTRAMPPAPAQAQPPQQPVPGTTPSSPGTPPEQQGQPRDPSRQPRQGQPRSPIEALVQNLLRQLFASRGRYPGRFPPFRGMPMMPGRGRFGRGGHGGFPFRGGFPFPGIPMPMPFRGGFPNAPGQQPDYAPDNEPQTPDQTPPSSQGGNVEPPEGFTGPMHPADRPPVQPDRLSPEGPPPKGGFQWGPYQRVMPEGGTQPIERRDLPPVPGATQAPDYTQPSPAPAQPRDTPQPETPAPATPAPPAAPAAPDASLSEPAPNGQTRFGPPDRPDQQLSAQQIRQPIRDWLNAHNGNMTGFNTSPAFADWFGRGIGPAEWGPIIRDEEHKWAQRNGGGGPAAPQPAPPYTPPPDTPPPTPDEAQRFPHTQVPNPQAAAGSPGNDPGTSVQPARQGFGADRQANARRPRHYGGMLTIGGAQFQYGTGGGRTPSLPYGRYYIHPGAVGPIGRRIGAIAGVSDSNNAQSNSLTDPTHLGGGGTHSRTGIEIHPSRSMMTNGCIGIDARAFPTFRQHFEQLARQGPLELNVHADGSAEISVMAGSRQYHMIQNNPTWVY